MPASSPTLRAALLLCALACAWALSSEPSARAAATAPSRSATSQKAVDPSDWTSLSPARRQVLAPLASQWGSLDSTARDKWIEVADRYPHLSPDAQQRMRSRMTQWAQLPPQQRGEARLRFQNSRQISAEERQKKWAAYQALPRAEREDLAQQARRKQNPVVLPDSEPGPREAAQQALATDRQRGGRNKTNVVPNTTHAAPAPQAITSTLVKAGPGATTLLVNQTATPPLHQHTGLSKINAARGFVDPQTLLPRKGPQGAAMTPVPPSQATPSASSATVDKR